MDREKNQASLSGCFIALPTLFRDEDLELNLAGMRRHVRFLLQGGVKRGNGVFLICGAAGEFPTLSLEERLGVLEAVQEEAGGKVEVILGAQSSNIREVVALARGAARLGAVAIQVSPPFYYPPTDEDVYEFMAAAAEAADIGVVIYATYWMGFKMSLDLIGRLADLPGIVGLKWAAPNAHEYDKGLRLFADKLCIIDNQLEFVHSVMQGARGINTHPGNYWPEWGVRLWGLLQEKKYREAQEEITKVIAPFYDLVVEVNQFTGGEGHLDKLCLELIGLDSSRCRPPTRDIRPAFREKARLMLHRCGVPHSV